MKKPIGIDRVSQKIKAEPLNKNDINHIKHGGIRTEQSTKNHKTNYINKMNTYIT